MCPVASSSIDDFITDSYRIRQGKMAILGMMGEEICSLSELPYDPMVEYQDSISEDDVINLAIYHPTRADLVAAIRQVNCEIGFRVRNGKIRIPDLPDLYVVGLTLDQARDAIEEAFKSEEVKDVDAFVSYRDRFQRKVELIGQVSIPHVPVDGRTRLYDVLSQARLPPTTNLFMSYVMRDGHRLAIDLNALVNKGNLRENIVMRGGDKIYIAQPNSAQVVVMGEVNRPVAIDMPLGFTTLPQAIVAAGGIPFTGDRDCIQIFRGGTPCPKIFLVSWCHLVHLPAESLMLIPGDTIFVRERPITQWNRFISQLLPSFTCFNTGFDCYKVFK